MGQASAVLERVDYNREQRIYDDTTTWLAEVLDGHMRTPFEYTFDGQELYGRDGGALKPIFQDAIADAEKTADHSPNLLFECRRRQIEMDEYAEMISMAKGNLPNTMVVVSDFPPELMDAAKDVGGYNVSRKQTMLRVITRGIDGEILMRSQSLDQSDRRGLVAMYSSLGVTAAAGELLGQRIHLDLPDGEQEFLVDGLMGVYDRSLEISRGGYWYAGRQDKPPINTYDFVLGQRDLIGAFVHVSNFNGLDESLLYDLAAEMNRRFNNRWSPQSAISMQAAKPLNEVLIDMQHAGQQARATSKTFSGCGISLSSNELTTKEQLNDLGYGNQSSEETKYAFDKKMHCVVCQAPPKKEEAKKMCGPCGICQTCDVKLKRKAKV